MNQCPNNHAKIRAMILKDNNGIVMIVKHPIARGPTPLCANGYGELCLASIVHPHILNAPFGPELNNLSKLRHTNRIGLCI